MFKAIRYGVGQVRAVKFMKEILNELIEHRSLSKDTAKQVLVDLASGKYNPSQVSAFMTFI